MSSVFQNLISNAIKYCDQQPKIHISVNSMSKPYNSEVWVFTIEDNGIGIKPNNLKKIFQIFQREYEDEAKYPGTGIGLAYCKKIIERHNGEIWVESELGKGSKFYFTLEKL